MQAMDNSGREQSRWLREGFLIVLSVALGFAFAQFGQYREDRQLSARIISNVQAELADNLNSLQPLVTLHRIWLDSLSKADTTRRNQSGLDVWFSTRPPLPADVKSAFPFLSHSAWNAAVSGGALRLIDYDLAADLSAIYRMQEVVNANINRLAQGALSSAATFDPNSRGPSVRLLWLTLADIESAERALLELYQKHLPTKAEQ